MAHWLTYLPTDKGQPGTSVTQNKGFSIYSEKRLKNWKHFLLKFQVENWVKKKVYMLKTLDNQIAA